MLWIGYLQWHFRTRGQVHAAEPVLKDFDNIECRDAVLAYDRMESVTDERGKPVTRWDGKTTKKHPVTGEEVPDETARVPRGAVRQSAQGGVAAGGFHRRESAVHRQQARCATRSAMDTSRRCATTWPDVPESADFVMYWWNQAARAGARRRKLRRFGLITTNSLRADLQPPRD